MTAAGSARRVALIGHPLRRRHSALMHTAAFRHYGIAATYELRDLAPDAVAGFVAEARGEEWLGFQVTAPYKQVVMPLLDELQAGAAAIGAVNSVARGRKGSLVGFNTDAPGFRRAAEAELGVGFAGIRAAVAGAGGAARAVVRALVEAKAALVVVGNRTPERAADLAADFGASVRPVVLGEEFADALGEIDLAINATTVGMIDPGVAFDVAGLPASAAVFDLVYTPPETELLRRARTRGLAAANGLGMLIAQAEIAFERWTGIAGAGPVMRAALGEEAVT
jgi:shikimate dehydrogenase